MAGWQILVGEQKYGAQNLEQIRAWIRDGRIPPNGLLYHPSLGDWVAADRIEEVAGRVHEDAGDPQVGIIRCPFCNSTDRLQFQKFTTGGIIVLLAGILLAPVCFGIILIFIAFGMREGRFRCQSCGRDY